jgi:xylulokinase
MPYPDPNARGAWVGLTVRHKRGHLTRAVLEGVSFGLRDGFELLQQAGLGAIEQVRVSGGGAKSALWRQILADVLNAPLATVNTTEGAAYGAALLAGVGAGLWPTVPAACAAALTATAANAPQPGEAAAYAAQYAQYQALYPALRPAFDALAA